MSQIVMDGKLNTLKWKLNTLIQLMQAKFVVKALKKQRFDFQIIEAMEIMKKILDKFSTLHEIMPFAIINEDKREDHRRFIADYAENTSKVLNKLVSHIDFLLNMTHLSRTKDEIVFDVIEDLQYTNHIFLNVVSDTVDSASASKHVFEGVALSDLESISGGAFTNKYVSEGIFQGVMVGEFETAIIKSLRVAMFGTRKRGCEDSTKGAFDGAMECALEGDYDVGASEEREECVFGADGGVMEGADGGVLEGDHGCALEGADGGTLEGAERGALQGNILQKCQPSYQE